MQSISNKNPISTSWQNIVIVVWYSGPYVKNIKEIISEGNKTTREIKKNLREAKKRDILRLMEEMNYCVLSIF
jgi:16S rRNA U516 pseudouridylate synthase RsuA-like enzyme